ncbi:DUF262 domain-containing protein [Agathobacter rectalis]|jgi:hypothetical protein|uniref:DUF262 domain-containing protein n=1 Tax=Agathobacter rectalis TaxID=39491 RepID=A0A415K0Q4_9FIRM|nr:DUF262 domain-containing protein [Agathobacter rectalis]RHL29879.1 DUF262 domain-containing protein [Agathobacter rectalis]
MDDILNYLNKVNQIKEDYIGLEDNWNDYEDAELPYDVNDIQVAQKMITVFQVEYWISNNLLDLQPEYQRNLVWDAQRKSLLIESLLLRIPIPAFYLDEKKDGKKSVIDGLQRLSTIHDFLNDKFRLKKLQYLSSCEDRTFSELDNKYKNYILDTTLSINVLGEQCPKMVKFDVFRRVNTGGLPLNSQEIRNIMAEPNVRTLLKKMSSNEYFIKATLGGINDVRMGAQELCLRYIAINSSYDWENHSMKMYYGLTKSMDYAIERLNSLSEKELAYVLEKFKNIMFQAHTILGDYSFCKLGQKRINTALFTSWAVVLSNINYSDSEILNVANNVRELYIKEMDEEGELYKVITSSTGSKKNIIKTIEIIRGLFDKSDD